MYTADAGPTSSFLNPLPGACARTGHCTGSPWARPGRAAGGRGPAVLAAAPMGSLPLLLAGVACAMGGLWKWPLGSQMRRVLAAPACFKLTVGGKKF